MVTASRRYHMPMVTFPEREASYPACLTTTTTRYPHSFGPFAMQNQLNKTETQAISSAQSLASVQTLLKAGLGCITFMRCVQFSSSCNAFIHGCPGIFFLTTTSQKVSLTLRRRQHETDARHRSFRHVGRERLTRLVGKFLLPGPSEETECQQFQNHGALLQVVSKKYLCLTHKFRR